MQNHATEQWESGRAPLVGRVYEVESLREIESLHQREDDVAEAAPDTRSKNDRSTPPPALLTQDNTRRASRVPALPFVEQIAAYVPGVSITVMRLLSLDEDLHLADHAFVHALGVKPLSACLPVVPLTMALEIMAETAACLAPGSGLIGFEDVRAARWIELADTPTLQLRISAEVAQVDPQRQIHRIAVGIAIADQPAPAIQATVLFAPCYVLDLPMTFAACAGARPHPCTGEQIYENRHMFHGPAYQRLTGQIVLHDRGIGAQAQVQAPAALFRSTEQPQLLTDPTLLDTAGQLLGIWAIEQRDRQVFPIGMKKLELYRPTPPAGSRCPVRIEITQEEPKTLTADVEIQDGSGAVWLRIKDWGAWKFRWPKRVTDFRRLPTRFPLSQPLTLPGLPTTAVCCLITPADVGRFDATLLARFCLDIDEMRAFHDKATVPRRQQHWLLGRIAAKDAARLWLARRDGTEAMPHPAALPIDSDPQGQPRLGRPASQDGLPKLSIAHCDAGAIALAASAPVGVDMEAVRPREPGFLETIASEAERRVLGGSGSGESGDASVTRLWCAKEAAGKLLGTGIDGSPRAFGVLAAGSDGLFRVEHRESGRVIAVRTLRHHDLIIAYATAETAAADQLSAEPCQQQPPGR